MVMQASRRLLRAALRAALIAMVVAFLAATLGLAASSCTFGTGPIDDYRCDVDGDCLSLETCIDGFCVIGTDGGAAGASSADAATAPADEPTRDAGTPDAAAED